MLRTPPLLRVRLVRASCCRRMRSRVFSWRPAPLVFFLDDSWNWRELDGSSVLLIRKVDHSFDTPIFMCLLARPSLAAALPPPSYSGFQGDHADELRSTPATGRGVLQPRKSPAKPWEALGGAGPDQRQLRRESKRDDVHLLGIIRGCWVSVNTTDVVEDFIGHPTFQR